MLCPNCETDNDEGARFCEECGFPLSGALARPAGAASPAGLRAESRGEGPGGTTGAPERNAAAPPAFGRGLEGDPEPGAVLMEPIDGGESPAPSYADLISSTSQDQWASVPSPEMREDAGDLPADAPEGDGWEIPSFSKEAEALEPDLARDGAWPSGGNPSWEVDAPSAAPAVGDSLDGAARRPDVTAPIGSPAWSSGSTMQMPRLAGERPSPGRDFRAASDRRGPSRRSIVAGVLLAVVVVVAALAAAGFALGIIGGKPVPDVTGMTEADARSLLEGEGFSVRSTKVKSDGTEGLVLIMDPGAGSRAPEGSEVVIHIATARFIPDVVGRTRDEALRLLEQEGYENVRIEMQRSEGDEGIVLSVTPDPGTRAKGSAEIVIAVSEAFRVPDISGLGLDDALAAIRNAELVPEVVYIDTDQFPEGTIIGTNPQAGTKVSQGEVVGVSVSRLRGIELVALTEELLAQGSAVNIGGIDYQIESVVSTSYQGDDVVAFTVTGRPFVTFFGERLFPSTSQTISGTVTWTSDNEVESIS